MWSPVEAAANKVLFSGLGTWLLYRWVTAPGWEDLWPIWIGVALLGLAFLRSCALLTSEHVKWVKFKRFHNEFSKPPSLPPDPWEDEEPSRDQGW